MSGTLRDPKKEAFWRRMLREQAGSGLSVRVWCDRCGLNPGTFGWWRRELARRDAVGRAPRRAAGREPGRMAGREAGRAEDAKPAFVPVGVAEGEAAGDGGCIEIVLAGGPRVRVSGRVDRQVLTEVLAAVSLVPEALDQESRAC